MPSLLPPLIAFAAVLLATPWIAASAGRLGLVDEPSARKVHVRPVPRTGGLGLMLGIVAGVLVALASGAIELEPVWRYVLPLLGFFALGWADDRFGVPPGRKLLIQIGLSALAVMLGLRWGGADVGGFGEMTFGAITPVMSALWLVAVLTVINWIDGIDLITTTTCIIFMALGAGAAAGPGGGALYLIAGAACAGFTFHNVTPARAFLGDSGTHALGFLVGALALELPSSAPSLPWALAAAPMLPGVVDIGLGLAAKLRHGIPIWRAHRQHVYQRLTRSGLSHVHVALRYGVLSVCAVACIGWLAPRIGALGATAIGMPILALHLVSAFRRTRGLPYEFAAEHTPARSGG